MKLYGDFSKTEEQDDGTIIVTGIASSEVVDAQGETITSSAMKAAIPDYMAFGAVREMHDSKKAAGTAVSISVEDDGNTLFSAHIVDPIAIKKVQTGVYKGFSIGGKVTQRNELNKSIIDGIRLSEISLVDRPANPSARFNCYKAEGAEDELGEVVADEPSATGDVEVAKAEDVVAAVAVADVAPVVEGAEVAKADESVQQELLIKSDIGIMRKRDDGSYELVPEDVIEKGAYSIGRLADLAESLESFAGYSSYNDGTNSTSIPNDARVLATKLYELLLNLVSVEVADAKQRIKDFKASKADEAEALQKVDNPHEALLKSFAEVYGAEGDKYEDVLNKVAEENLSLTKRVKELEAMPTPAKAKLMVVEKGADLVKANEESAVPATPLDAMKKAQSSAVIVR